MRIASASAAAVLLAVTAAAQQAAISIIPVQGHVSMLTAGDVNITVQAGADGPVLVDTPPASMAEPVLAELRKLSPRPIRHIIQTSASDEPSPNSMRATVVFSVGMTSPL